MNLNYTINSLAGNMRYQTCLEPKEQEKKKGLYFGWNAKKTIPTMVINGENTVEKLSMGIQIRGHHLFKIYMICGVFVGNSLEQIFDHWCI